MTLLQIHTFTPSIRKCFLIETTTEPILFLTSSLICLPESKSPYFAKQQWCSVRDIHMLRKLVFGIFLNHQPTLHCVQLCYVLLQIAVKKYWCQANTFNNTLCLTATYNSIGLFIFAYGKMMDCQKHVLKKSCKLDEVSH